MLIEFPGHEPTGTAGEALLDLVDRDLIRIYDLFLIHKDEDGLVTGLEINDLSDKGLGGFTVFSGAQSGLMGDEDRHEAAAAMKPGTASVLIVYENTWAIPFVAAARDAGAELIASASASWRCTAGGRTDAGRRSAGSTGFSTIRTGATTCCSSSTTTATTAPAWARCTKPAGRA